MWLRKQSVVHVKSLVDQFTLKGYGLSYIGTGVRDSIARGYEHKTESVKGQDIQSVRNSSDLVGP